MDKKTINDFSRRINQGNKSEIIVVLYDIFFAYIDDAKTAFAAGDEETAMTGIRRASQTIEHLKQALNFSYELAGHLYPLYVFAQRHLTRAMYKNDPAPLAEAEDIMRPLSEAFDEVAKADDSKAVVQHGENIVAGYTYGRNDINEVSASYDANRGFLA